MTTKLTKIQLSALRDFEDGERKNALQLGISSQTIQNLYFKGFLKSCNWSRNFREIDMTISKEGLEALREVKEKEKSDD